METLNKTMRDGWLVINTFFDGLWVFLHNGLILRRVGVIFTLWLTYHAAFLIRDIALGSMVGGDKAMVIAAIATPMAGLQSVMLKFYNDARQTKVTDGKDQKPQ